MEEEGTRPRGNGRGPYGRLPPDQTWLPGAEPTAVQDIRDALVIREGDLFLLTDTDGQVPSHNQGGYGLYYADTRYVSAYGFSLGQTRPVVLLSTAELGYSEEQVLTNPTMYGQEGRILPRGSIEVRRQRVVKDILEETLRITNYNVFPVTVDLCYSFGADFADIFEVRGHKRAAYGNYYEPQVGEANVIFAYKGRDGQKRETLITFSPAPVSMERIAEDNEVRATFRVALSHRESAAVRTVIAVDGRLESAQGVERFSAVAQEYQEWRDSVTRVYTDNDFFDAVISRSLGDLRMLWNYESDIGSYPAAGTPWFDTLFGRDTCIVSLETLAFQPEVARQCLKVLSRYQGKKFDSWRDEEPGKILHELRRDELTLINELPYSPYYGSIDATLLFLWLAGEFYAWTADIETIRELEPNLRAALHWLQAYGDLDKDGYVEYEKRSVKGLVNQGWKDSGDSIVHADGTLVEPPTALVEVEGYLYAAKRTLGPVFAALGDVPLAEQLKGEANSLKRRFNRDFWLPAERFFALALDGAKRPAAAITSNPGHALWSGIASREHARQVVERLMRNDMFSGWGIRTLSTTSPRFNPFGYHLGTVWPHDNALIGVGFKKYGFEEELNEVTGALFDAARAFPYYRLPELFGGAARFVHHAPVPYPVACRPQAWVAGAFPILLQAILGLFAEAPNRCLRIVRPRLPHWLEEVQLEGLRVGRGEVDLYYERRGNRTRGRVLRVRGDLKVEFVGGWPA